MNSERFAALTERLLRAGVAHRHARRAVLELSEHHADLVEELRAQGAAPAEIETHAAARLGTDEEFVRRMLERRELRSFACRRPFVAFTVLPLGGFVALLGVSVGLLIAALHLMQPGKALSPTALAWLRWILDGLFVLALWLAPVAAGAVSCWIAVRQRVPARWAASGAIVVALLAASMNGNQNIEAATGHGSVGLGIGFSTHLSSILALAGRAGILMAAMLVPFLWYLRRQSPDAVSR